MKKLMKSLMLFAAAAMALTSCENEAMNEGIEVNDTYTMTFVAGAPESKTSVAIDGENATFSWSADDKVGFYKVANGIEPTVTNYKEKTNATAAIEGETATFKPTFKAAEGATNYNIGAFYPSDSWVSHADENHFSNVNVKILASQNLTEDSFDPKADLLMSKPLKGVAFSDDAMALQFTRLAAIGKMNLKLTDMVEGEVIESVKFTLAEGTHFNGPVILNFENTSYTFGTEDTSNSVTISGELAANADRTAIFFTCFPGEYSGAYTINVTTDKATYSKEGTINNAMKFTEGNVLDFNATVGNRHVEVLEEGTIVDVLNREVTGVTNGSTSYTNWTATGTSGVVYAGNSAGNNDAIQLRWDTSKATSGIVTTTSCGAAKKVVVTWDSNTADSRILNIYGRNTAYTSVDDLKNNAGTLLGTIARADQTTLEIDGDYAYIGMRSTTGAMYLDKIEITWKPDSRTALTTPVVSATAEGKNVTVSWGDVENAGSYTLTYGETVVENATSPYEFEGEYSATYNFSVVAVPSDDTSHKNSAEGTAEVTIEADPNVGGGDVVAGWVKISALSELAAGDKVALVGTVGTTDYSMTTNSTSKAPTATTVTISDNTLSSVDGITTFNIGKSGSNYILYEGDATSTWLYCTNANNGVRSGTNANKTWVIASHSEGGSNFEFKHVGTNRFLGIYNKADWRCYDAVDATNFTNGNGTSDIAIYKYVSGGSETPEPEEPTIVAPTITIDDISDVAAAGVTNAEQTVGLGSPVGNWTYTVTSEATWLSNMSLSEGKVIYTVAANTGDARDATVTITASCDGQTDVTKTFTIAQLAGESGGGGDVVTDTTVTILPKNLNTSYNKTSPGDSITIDDVTFYAYYTMQNASKIQMYKNSGFIANKTSLGTIKTITITYNSSEANKNCSVYVGNSELPSGTTINASTSGNVYTFDCTSGNYSYFKILNGSGAAYVDSIAVTYAN